MFVSIPNVISGRRDRQRVNARKVSCQYDLATRFLIENSMQLFEVLVFIDVDGYSNYLHISETKPTHLDFCA